MFSKDQLFCVLDYETYSEADLKKVGAFEYSVHDSSEVLCVSFRVGTIETLGKAKVYTYAPSMPWNQHRSDLHKNDARLAKILNNKNIIIVAHNALFEQAVTRNVLPKHIGTLLGHLKRFPIPSSRFFCTAVLAAIYALPRKLELVGEALDLGNKKDMSGHRMMLKWSKPRKPTKNNPATRHMNPDEFDRVVEYCEQDLYTETEVFLSLKIPPLKTRLEWLFDQKVNFRGVNVDVDLVKKVSKLIEEEKVYQTKRLRKLTKGKVKTGGQRDVLLSWLQSKEIYLPDLKGKTVEDAINSGLVDGIAKKVLQLRQDLTKTSLKKYKVFIDHTGYDGRVRFSLLFNGASTGRFTAQGVQLHNCPRGTLKYKYEENGKTIEVDLAPLACELIKDGASLELIRTLFGNPTEVFVSCIRGMMIASPGKELFVADYAAIEARVLFWLADHHEGVKAFKEGRKMYEEMAMTIFKLTSISKVSKDQRFVGKQTILGSGYGMGAPKFMSSCKDYGQDVSLEISKIAIESYRKKHKPVPDLWKKLEKVAILAVQNPTKTFKINHTEWFMEGRFLACRLPSGRCIYYCDPKVTLVKKWGQMMPELSYMAVHPKTKKWVREKTWGGKITENVVQAISRDMLLEAMMRLEKAGYEIILTVHDEIIGERKIGEGSVAEFVKLMKQNPEWAKDAPIDVEGYSGQRYSK